MLSQTFLEKTDKYIKVYASILERLYGSDKEWEPIEICENDPDYSEKMSRYGAEAIKNTTTTGQQAGTTYGRRKTLGNSRNRL